jgi:2,5-diamino-6-(ribosylamino)-4(3H)-pyrimidinone 5'-phosphate reductase
MLPRVILHNAVSLDGRMDWFTPNLAQYYALAAHWKEEATLVGSNTILIAQNTVPPEDSDGFVPQKPKPGDTRPLLVVPDSRGRIHTWHYWRKQPYWRALVVLVSRSTPQSYLDYLQARCIDYLVTGDDHVDLRAVLEIIYDRYGVKVLRVDSGGTLNGALLRAGLVNEVSLLISPALVGGTSPRSIFLAQNLTSHEEVIPLKLIHIEQLDGDTVWLCYEVANAG